DLTGFHRTVLVATPGLTKEVGGWTFNGGDYTLIVSNTAIHFDTSGIQVNGGTATILTINDAEFDFFAAADGGNARYIIDSTSSISLSGTTGPNNDNQISMGSLEGSGVVILASGQTLSIGGNNLSTYFSGGFAVEGIIPEGGSLVKIG